jgi:predicted amidophosphoribosyltransferase
MGLQNCADCGNQVSTKAKKCPHCGAPVKRQTGGGCLAVLAAVLEEYANPVDRADDQAASFSPSLNAMPAITSPIS